MQTRGVFFHRERCFLFLPRLKLFWFLAIKTLFLLLPRQWLNFYPCHDNCYFCQTITFVFPRPLLSFLTTGVFISLKTIVFLKSPQTAASFYFLSGNVYFVESPLTSTVIYIQSGNSCSFPSPREFPGEGYFICSCCYRPQTTISNSSGRAATYRERRKPTEWWASCSCGQRLGHI